MERLGKYTDLEKIGRGAMGVVYKGRDPFLGRTVAIKLMSADFDAEPELLERFQREAQVAVKLSHKNITEVYDGGVEEGRPYIVMEFLDGQNLREAMDGDPPLTLERRVDIIAQVCAGLAHAHERGIVHRDIKPSNIHLTDEGGVVKLLDFGLARISGSDMTATGMVMGTPGYMSPEQVDGKHADHRSDIFSLGVVTYELMAGQKPFHDASLARIFVKISTFDPDPVHTVRADLPEELTPIIQRALAKDTSDRYQSADEMLEDLRQLRVGLRERADGAHKELEKIASQLTELRDGHQTLLGRRATGDAAEIPDWLQKHIAEPPENYLELREAGEKAAKRLEGMQTLIEKLKWVDEVADLDFAAQPQDRLAEIHATAKEILREHAGLPAAVALKESVEVERRRRKKDAEKQRRLDKIRAEAAELSAAGKHEHALEVVGRALTLDAGNAESLELERQIKAAIEEARQAKERTDQALRSLSIARSALTSGDLVLARRTAEGALNLDENVEGGRALLDQIARAELEELRQTDSPGGAPDVLEATQPQKVDRDEVFSSPEWSKAQAEAGEPAPPAQTEAQAGEPAAPARPDPLAVTMRHDVVEKPEESSSEPAAAPPPDASEELEVDSTTSAAPPPPPPVAPAPATSTPSIPPTQRSAGGLAALLEQPWAKPAILGPAAAGVVLVGLLLMWMASGSDEPVVSGVEMPAGSAPVAGAAPGAGDPAAAEPDGTDDPSQSLPAVGEDPTSGPVAGTQTPPREADPEPAPADSSAGGATTTTTPEPAADDSAERAAAARLAEANDLAAEIPRLIAAERWDDAAARNREFANLAPGDSRFEACSQTIRDGRARTDGIATMRRSVTTALSRGDADAAEDALGALLQAQPNEPQASGWRRQINDLRIDAATSSASSAVAAGNWSNAESAISEMRRLGAPDAEITRLSQALADARAAATPAPEPEPVAEPVSSAPRIEVIRVRAGRQIPAAVVLGESALTYEETAGGEGFERPWSDLEEARYLAENPDIVTLRFAGTDGGVEVHFPGERAREQFLTHADARGVAVVQQQSAAPDTGGAPGSVQTVPLTADVEPPRLVSEANVELQDASLQRLSLSDKRITIMCLVDADGSVVDARVLRIDPPLALEQASEALKESIRTSAIRYWRFEPARRNGTPVAVWTAPFAVGYNR